MISRFGSKNFFAAHYELIAVVVGALVLNGGAVMFMMSGEDAMADERAQVSSMKTRAPGQIKFDGVDTNELSAALRQFGKPATVTAFDPLSASFLASERRVLCSNPDCKRAIRGNFKENPNCPYCGTRQLEEVKVVLDQDEDGMPDAWEKKFGFNVNDASDATADFDKDGFTNLEEYQAKTDPTDRRSHPDYLDSLKIVLPLEETYLDLVFTKAIQLPGKDQWRCEFIDPSRRNQYNKLGRTVSVRVGERIIDTSDRKEKVDYKFTLEKYERKSVKKERPGMKGMFVDQNVSEVTLKRVSDGKIVVLKIQEGREVKDLEKSAVDVRVKLDFPRGGKHFAVVKGDQFELFDTKYLVLDVQPIVKGNKKGAKIVVEEQDPIRKKTRELEALEP